MHGNLKHKFLYPALERWLRENHKSITELADDAGLPQNTVCNFAFGLRDSRLSTVQIISEATKIPIGELLQK